MTSFLRKWLPLRKRAEWDAGPPAPLRSKLEKAQRIIDHQVARLEAAAARIRRGEADLLGAAASLQEGPPHALAYSNELAEPKTAAEALGRAKTLLEGISLRLTTVNDLNAFVGSLTPAVSMLERVQRDLEGLIPQPGTQIREIGGVLSDIITDVSGLNGLPIVHGEEDEEVKKILAEAAAAAEKKHRRGPFAL